MICINWFLILTMYMIFTSWRNSPETKVFELKKPAIHPHGSQGDSMLGIRYVEIMDTGKTISVILI